MSTAILPEPDARASAAGVWDYISPSRLNLWLKCPLAFRLRYVDGIVTPSSPAQHVGKLVHVGLEHYYRHRQAGITLSAEELGSRLDALFDSVDETEALPEFQNGEEELQCRAQARQLLAAYLQQVPTDEPRPLAVETRLEAPLVDPTTCEHLGIPLVGILDLVLPGANGPVIADFKTTARGGELLEVVHEIQLTSYALLFRQASGQQESALEVRSLIKTKVPRAETHRFAARRALHFKRLFHVIRAYLDDLDRGTFLYRPSSACTMCEYRHGCCAS